MRENIVLIGFMGTGKSTVAGQLCKEYGMQQVEMDQVIAKREGLSIPDIFNEKGEAYFRDRETELLIELQGKKNQVISCGGGAALRQRNVAEMKKNGKVVLLTASPEVILGRVENNDDRPLLAGRKNVEGIARLLEERRERYEAAADIVIDTDRKTSTEVCEEIIRYVSSILPR